MPNSVKTRAITSRCQDEDEDEDKELQIIHGSVDGGGAIRSQEASKSTSWTLQGQKSPQSSHYQFGFPNSPDNNLPWE